MRDADFAKWMEQWEKAQKEGVFASAPKPSEQPTSDYFGVYRPKGENVIRDVDAKYWDKVYRLSSHQGDSPDPLLNEDYEPVENKELAPTTEFDGKKIGKITDELGGLANPVSPVHRGKDKTSKVTPNWAGGKDIIELHKMKVQLQKLEDKIAVDPMQKSKVDQQIKDLWNKIDELSDSLNPDYEKDYLS
jgi:hypothetical protein